MTLSEIKAAVIAGRTVHWKNAGYVVHTDRRQEFYITWDLGGHKSNSIGLTHQDGVTLNGKEHEFFIGGA